MWVVKVKEFSEFVHTVLDGLQCEALGVGLSASDLFEEVSSPNEKTALHSSHVSFFPPFKSPPPPPTQFAPSSAKGILQLVPGLEVSFDVGLPCKTNIIITTVCYGNVWGSSKVQRPPHL